MHTKENGGPGKSGKTNKEKIVPRPQEEEFSVAKAPTYIHSHPNISWSFSVLEVG